MFYVTGPFYNFKFLHSTCTVIATWKRGGSNQSQRRRDVTINWRGTKTKYIRCGRGERNKAAHHPSNGDGDGNGDATECKHWVAGGVATCQASPPIRCQFPRQPSHRLCLIHQCLSHHIQPMQKIIFIHWNVLAITIVDRQIVFLIDEFSLLDRRRPNGAVWRKWCLLLFTGFTKIPPGTAVVSDNVIADPSFVFCTYLLLTYVVPYDTHFTWYIDRE